MLHNATIIFQDCPHIVIIIIIIIFISASRYKPFPDYCGLPIYRYYYPPA